MTRPQNSAVFAAIRDATTFPDQIEALRSLKNEVSGHVQRKEKWVGCGILGPIVEILRASRSSMHYNPRDSRGATMGLRRLSEEEQLCLQALQLVAIFANGKTL